MQHVGDPSPIIKIVTPSPKFIGFAPASKSIRRLANANPKIFYVLLSKLLLLSLFNLNTRVCPLFIATRKLRVKENFKPGVPPLCPLFNPWLRQAVKREILPLLDKMSIQGSIDWLVGRLILVPSSLYFDPFPYFFSL